MPPGHPKKDEPEREEFRPIAESTHIDHKIVHDPVSMLCHEIIHRGIEMKRGRDDNRRNDNPQKPIKNRAALHK